MKGYRTHAFYERQRTTYEEEERTAHEEEKLTTK